MGRNFMAFIRTPFVNKDLFQSTHLYVHNNRVTQSMTESYDDPCKVVSNEEKYFTIEIKGRNIVFSYEEAATGSKLQIL